MEIHANSKRARKCLQQQQKNENENIPVYK